MNKKIKEKLKNSRARVIGFYFLDFINYLKYKILNRDIVFIYQMGKVASSSIYSSLKAKGKIVYHVHRLNETHIRELHIAQMKKSGNIESKVVDERGVRLYNRYIKKNKKPIYILSMVRNPIDRNISAFFQNKEHFTKKHNYSDVDKLTNLFYNLYDHNTPLLWFDREFKHCLNIDIYSSPFHKEKKYKIIKEENFNVLLIRVDLEDKLKEEIISDFLRIKNFKLKNKNVGSEKSYNREYKAFKKTIKLDENYINRMLNSKFTNYFYSEVEINQIKKKWLKKI
ncbi:MAG TPA: putative capsular polysaccharide synthesis family protein [Flavobacteriaceae bacterium]|nr:putative capsular polysaccharide synthesis family protein [Flavobacteriaceae bacterium]